VRATPSAAGSGYTDTHGFTEQLLGLCHLLGFSFMPRLKDLKDQQLYRPDREPLGVLERIIDGTVDTALIREQWDQLVRVAASLRNRTAPAHLVLERLAGSPRSRSTQPPRPRLAAGSRARDPQRHLPVRPGRQAAPERVALASASARMPPGPPVVALRRSERCYGAGKGRPRRGEGPGLL
jgi:hypothetical protein